MFDPSDTARVFAVPPGADFPRAMVEGIRHRMQESPPEAMAQVQIVVNTSRMARRIKAVFAEGPACLMPRIHVLSDFGQGDVGAEIPPAVPPMRRRFELIQLITELLHRQPDLASRASIYDLADSLAGLMEEMEGEGVEFDAIEGLDVSDLSGHWERSKAFIGIVRQFFDDSHEAPSRDARQRRIVRGLIDSWQARPPKHPIILAGSTGSRGTTMMLMQAIARLPQGAVILPGYDFDMPPSVWGHLTDGLTGEDHPQFRFRKLLDSLDLEPDDVLSWARASAPCPPRNKLVSLALRPAPVTDQWLTEGPALTDLDVATHDVTLIKAASAREEALVIAARLRQAAETGQTAALITPDRMLTRQVTAALDRWGIVPDDSAGTPLHLTPPGRFLRHVASLFQQELTTEALLTLLKHPLTQSGADRGPHLLFTRDLELYLRRKSIPYPDEETLRAWGEAHDQAAGWACWVADTFCLRIETEEIPFSARCAAHIALAERIAHGPGEGSGGLWQENAGREAARLVQGIRENADIAGMITANDYADLFGAVISRGEVRDRDSGHPGILIWGTLEARVQGADLIILGGLNEGSWPESPAPDPWLNRKMRHDAGMLLPERRIGLSAHDFQQAVCAPQVWLTRAVRSDDSETVPSRWINRLTNLLDGLPENGGPEALKAMEARGQEWLNLVRAMETFPGVDPAKRPSPTPPPGARPVKLSVTEVKKLIRDPYAIYARHVLRLRPLDPLMRTPDALLRGILVHEVLERLIGQSSGQEPVTRERLLAISETVLAENVPWGTARVLWQSRLERIAEHFVEGEKERRDRAVPCAFEARAEAKIKEPPFTLTGYADRIDRTPEGDLILYDYKTGNPPSVDEQKHFDKQLLLEAAMAERGAFLDLQPAHVADAIFIGLGTNPKDQAAPLDDSPPNQIWAEFVELITHYTVNGKGFTSRRAMRSEKDEGDYDQLARFGEWDITDPPEPEELT